MPSPADRFAALRARAEGHRVLGPALAVQERFSQLDGNGTATAVTVSVLLSVIPLLLVAIAIIGFIAEGRDDLAGELVERFRLSPTASDALEGVLETAGRNRRSSSVVGLLGLAWTALNVGAALQQVVNRTWQMTGRGLKDKAFSLMVLLGLAVILGVSMTLTGLINGLGGRFAILSIPAGTALTTAGFLWLFWFLAPLRVGWRSYLPGAVAAAIGFEVLKFLGAVLLPRLIANSTALYGSIGAFVGLLGFLLFFGRLVVYSSVLNVVLYERAHGTREVTALIPDIPTHGAVVVTRALAVKVGAAADAGRRP